MESGHRRNVLRHFRQTLLLHDDAGMTDGQLLERFVAQRDEAAFAALVRRHGPMVLGVCRRVLRDSHDAEDAFQATFLVLVRKAASLRQRELVGNWLYGAAYRAALETRAANAAGRAKERQVRDMPEREARVEADVWQELRPLLDQELSRLPDKYRVPVVLCDLEGRKRKEVACQLCIPEGTLSSRLATARTLLARRLARRGLALPAGALAAALSGRAALATVTPPLLSATLQAAASFTAGPTATAGAISAKVAAVTDGLMKSLLLSKLKVATAVLAFLVIVGGLGGLTYCMQAASGNPSPAATTSPHGAGVLADDNPDTPPRSSPPFRKGVPGKVLADNRPDTHPPDPLADLPDTRVTPPGWGTPLDPDGDCKLTFDKDKLTITVPASDHALCVEFGRMNAPRVLRDVEGDFQVQVRVSGAFPDGAQSVVKDRNAFHGAGLLLWQDEKTYVRLERANLTIDRKKTSYVSFELRRDGRSERFRDVTEMPLTGEPVYLRLERRGDTVLAAGSKDDVHWTYLAPLKMKLPQKVRVGVLAGQNTSKGFTAEFSDFKLLR